MLRTTAEFLDVPIDFDIQTNEPEWSRYPLDPWAARIIKALGAHPQTAGIDGEVAVSLADDETLRDLNAAWRGKDRPTNVLSYPSGDLPAGIVGPVPLGDLVLSYQTCAREAEEKAVPFANHAIHLLVHGVLHLLGYDHETEAEAIEMEGLETDLLAAMGIDDPYAALTDGDVDA